MDRSVRLALNNYPSVPTTLRDKLETDVAQTMINVNLARLYHHYFHDSFGTLPPDPDPANFEHLKFLTPTKDFRLQGNGIGANTLVRRNRSAELGQAFCRWLLHDHLNVTFFAHIEEVMERDLFGQLRHCRLERKKDGDVPDYLCMDGAHGVYLAEAKGRYSSIGFKTKEFQSWRNQFDRICFKNELGQEQYLKGHIVATRFATEHSPQNFETTVYAEDPTTPGNQPLNEVARLEIGNAVRSIHYSQITAKLGQPILSASLRTGFIVPEEIQFPGIVWEFQMPPLKGLRFVGGYFPSSDGVLPIQQEDGRVLFRRADPFRLGIAAGTFYGVQEKVFRQLTSAVRGREVPDAIFATELSDIPPFYSGISNLRDGSILGPVEFFRPIESIVF